MPRKKSEISADRYYTIVAKQSGKVLQADEDGMVRIYHANGQEEQQWRFEPAGEFYKIISKHTGQLLDIILAGSENGAHIHQWDDLGAENQLWMLRQEADGSYAILAKSCGRCLDVAGLSQADGSSLQIWDDVGGENQRWQLLPLPAPRKPVTRKRSAAGQTADSAKKPAVTKSPSKAKEAAKKPAAPNTAKKLAASPEPKKLAEPKTPKKLTTSQEPKKLTGPKAAKKLTEKSGAAE